MKIWNAHKLKYKNKIVELLSFQSINFFTEKYLKFRKNPENFSKQKI